MSATWQFLQQFHLNPPALGVLPRKKNVQEAYAMHSAKLAKVGMTLDEYIHKNVLQAGSPFTITLNDFPYDLEVGIQHYLLWLAPKATITQQEVLDIIKSHFKEKEFVCYQNHPSTRSIKSIDHYQIFVKGS